MSPLQPIIVLNVILPTILLSQGFPSSYWEASTLWQGLSHRCVLCSPCNLWVDDLTAMHRKVHHFFACFPPDNPGRKLGHLLGSLSASATTHPSTTKDHLHVTPPVLRDAPRTVRAQPRPKPTLPQVLTGILSTSTLFCLSHSPYW